MSVDRRTFLRTGLGGVLAAGAAQPTLAAIGKAAPDTNLISLADRLLQENAASIDKTDIVGIANFAAPSWRPRFHLVDIKSERVESFLVSHGRGSDPGHTGWLQRFSNQIGSNASSYGAYRTGDFYVGKHGRSMRLAGLDAENSNAEARAIVVHAAWYVGEDIVAKHGKLGRSEGCFAFSEAGLEEVLGRLGPGRLLYAGKI